MSDSKKKFQELLETLEKEQAAELEKKLEELNKLESNFSEFELNLLEEKFDEDFNERMSNVPDSSEMDNIVENLFNNSIEQSSIDKIANTTKDKIKN